jgi:chromosome segregation ATPase
MAHRAQLTSVEALESFRANLIVFLSKARPTLDEVGEAVTRTRVWLQSTQRSHWESQVQRRSRELEEARQELFRAKLSNLHEVLAAQQMAVARAQHALREAEAKLRLLKKWAREFENLASPLARQVDQLQAFLTTDMSHAVAYLGQLLNTLEAYLDTVPAADPTGPAHPGTPTNAEDAVESPEPAGPSAPEAGKPGGRREEES